MKKVSAAAGAFFLCFTASAWASGPSNPSSMESYNNNSSSMMPNPMGMNSSSSSGMPGGFTMPVNPNALANTYAGSGMMPNNTMGMTGGSSRSMGGSYPSSYPSTGSSTMPMIDLRRVVWQGMQGLPAQQQQSGATAMAYRNLQNMGSGMSSISQLRNNIRNQIMGNRINEISQMGQSTFRPMIQPGAVQSMISQIQPWNFPIRFQSAMMPMMVPYVSQPIKPQQMAYMQQGIMNNPNFPNVPLPSPVYSPYGSGGMMPNNNMSMGNMMPNMGGMMMPSGGMGMSGSGYGMMPYNGMMPGMGMGMGNMMPNMGMMVGGGYYPSYY